MAPWLPLSLGLLVFLACYFQEVSCQSEPEMVALPEMYLANVAGRIPGTDVMKNKHPPKCPRGKSPNSRYRELDGTCNHPLDYGSTMQPVKRYIAPNYGANDSPRTNSVYGTALPSPRAISRLIHSGRDRRGRHTLWVMQMGQFIDHDITSAPVPTEENASIKCCVGRNSTSRNKECFPIDIPAGDPVFDSCMEFVRSEPHKDDSRRVTTPREQLNALTSFIDGSAIYGDSEESLKLLRTLQGRGALLKTLKVDGRERLPHDRHIGESRCAAKHNTRSYCMLSGDHRVNEQPGLGSTHLLFHLFHNDVVRKLARAYLMKKRKPRSAAAVNKFLRRGTPRKIHRTLFQEARKIVGGVLQKIIYCDWLPLVLGPSIYRHYELGCNGRSSYNPYTDPRIANGFLSAAFRFGHTLIPNKLKMGTDEEISLKDNFMVPDMCLNHYEKIMTGMQQDNSAEIFDHHVVDAVRNHLFQSTRGPSKALDLISLNIQRGRDHGVPSYFYWREYYHLGGYTSFEEFPQTKLEELKSLYKHALDVDLFVGSLLESSVPGGIVGETFGHMIGNQFKDLKFGDRFFFMTKDLWRGFTDAQLAVIKRITLRDVVCTCGGIKEAQDNVFLRVTHINQPKKCTRRRRFKPNPWMVNF